MGDYWSEWEQKGQHWVSIFKRIDPVVSAFAKEHDMTVMPWHWDEPSRILVWRSQGFNRSIRLLIEGQDPTYTVNSSGSMWKDVIYEGELVRHWHYEDFGKVADFTVGNHHATPVTSTRAIYTRLKDLWGRVSDWAEAEQQTKLGKTSELRYLP